mmetsp:Transcript_21197/g.40217  ORF Transcript_21197/g.40217 Transcript_21197/m.40217 type:complete len:129 (+) Transcript_21197:183-569(+)
MCEQQSAIDNSSPSPVDEGKHCPCFTVFIRVLLKYLKRQGDLEAYTAVKKRVLHGSDCSQKPNSFIPCFDKEVLQDIPKIVKPSDLRRVRCYLRLRVHQKKRLQSKTTSDKTTSIQCSLFGIIHRVFS